jgi:hypothetical protein
VAGVDDIPLVVGGTIPAQDVPALAGLGVRAVYGVGTPIEEVVAGVLGLDHGTLDHGTLDHGTLDHGAVDQGALDGGPR